MSAPTTVLATLQQLAPTLTVSNGTATATLTNLDLNTVITSMFPDLTDEVALLPTIDFPSITVTYTLSTDTGSLSASFDIDSGKLTGQLNLDVAKNTAGAIEYIALLGLPKTLDLGENLPLVGPELTGKFTFNEAYLSITSETTDTVKSSAKAQPTTIPIGIAFVFSLTVIDQKYVTVPVYKYPPAAAAPAPPAPADGDKAGEVKVQKDVGPINVSSYTISYASGKLSLDISATLTLGPINVSLDDLSMSVSFSDLSSPSFDLSGLGFDYDQAPLKIEGAIDHIEPPPQGTSFEYNGDLVVQAESFGLSAIASYAQLTNGSTSFFIFADVEATLGGPPFFIVTGLMGGFGYNRTLKLPTFDKVADFPLLALQGKGQTADQVLSTLESGKWITPKQGDYWLAAGINFTSFEIITGQLLLVAEFGNDLKFAVLGLASLSLPKGDSNPFVSVELQIEVELEPTLGYFSAAASLTKNSYVLTKDCHLTGGFAFDLWFGHNPNAGQFVLTAGGYNPAFTAPSFFPQVERLAFNWKVSSDISITGGAYFAMTPSCGMAGGSLDVLFQAGPIKAWFDAAANFLVTWHPFHFNGNISISIGASVKLDLLVCHTTVSVSLGASLSIWGSPLGGTVSVHIVIVTVTISFGSSGATTPSYYEPLAWSDFMTKLLPQATDICKIVNNAGLTTELADGTWVVRSGSFGFSTQSAIPSSTMNYGAAGATTNVFTATDPVNIRPMFEAAITSTHNIQITDNNNGNKLVDVKADSWTLTANNGDMPETLWGTLIPDTASPAGYTQNPPKPTSTVVAGQLVGFTVTAPSPTYATTFGPVLLEVFAEEPVDNAQPPSNPLNQSVTDNADFTTKPSATVISDIGGINGGTVAASRTAIIAALGTGLYSGQNGSLTNMAADAGKLFSQAPLEQAS